MKIEPLHQDFGARITGLDMSAPPSGAALDDLRAIIDEHSFLVFPDQAMDDDRQLALTRALGEPEFGHVAYGETGRIEYFATIGNVQPDGTALGNDHRRTIFLTGNNMWHSDNSFREVPAFLSITSAHETPDEGGETIFVSMRAAIHDYTYSRSKAAEVSSSLSKSLPPVRQKLVRANPRTGAKSLFLGSHVREIEGLGFEASRPLLDALTTEATRDEHTYAHHWRPGDLVFWDNRCLLHRGAGYDADKYRRNMRQTRVRGAGSSLEE